MHDGQHVLERPVHSANRLHVHSLSRQNRQELCGERDHCVGVSDNVVDELWRVARQDSRQGVEAAVGIAIQCFPGPLCTREAVPRCLMAHLERLPVP